MDIIFAAGTLNLTGLLAALFFSSIITGVVFGCGARYRYRGINPSSRNPMNYNDGHYFERIGAEESDYP